LSVATVDIDDREGQTCSNSRLSPRKVKIGLTEFELAETALTRINLLDVYLADVPLTNKFLTEFVMTRDCLPKQSQLVGGSYNDSERADRGSCFMDGEEKPLWRSLHIVKDVVKLSIHPSRHPSMDGIIQGRKPWQK
jgi:hypothetical protein